MPGDSNEKVGAASCHSLLSPALLALRLPPAEVRFLRTQARFAVKPAGAPGGPDRRTPLSAGPRSAAQPSPLGFVSRIPTPPGARRAPHGTSSALPAAQKLPPPAARGGGPEPAEAAGAGATPELLAKRAPGAASAQAAAPAPQDILRGRHAAAQRFWGRGSGPAGPRPGAQLGSGAPALLALAANHHTPSPLHAQKEATAGCDMFVELVGT